MMETTHKTGPRVERGEGGGGGLTAKMVGNWEMVSPRASHTHTHQDFNLKICDPFIVSDTGSQTNSFELALE
jgi:hypothetical protein